MNYRERLELLIEESNEIVATYEVEEKGIPRFYLTIF